MQRTVQAKDVEVILTVKIETRHPVGRPFGHEFSAFVIIAELWRPEVANFTHIGFSTTCRVCGGGGKNLKIALVINKSEWVTSLHCPTRHTPVNFVDVFPTALVITTRPKIHKTSEKQKLAPCGTDSRLFTTDVFVTFKVMWQKTMIPTQLNLDIVPWFKNQWSVTNSHYKLWRR